MVDKQNMHRISGFISGCEAPTVARRISCLMSHVTSTPPSPPPTATSKLPTVGIIVIGDEILKGQTQDTNSSFLASRLFAIGVRVNKISVIPDDIDTIAKEVSEFSSKFTHVITSGGIGPTHDDVTFEAVARAFGERVLPHPEIVALCKEFFGTDDLKSPKLKLAFIPESSALCYGIDRTTGSLGKYPIVRIRNVFIFPGVPKLLRTAFERLEGMFRNPEAAFHTSEIYIAVDEASIAGILNEANDIFKDRVTMGSYPDFYSNYYKVKLTLESMQQSDVEEMRDFLFKKLPSDSIVDFDKDPIVHAAERVYALVNSDDQEFGKKIRHSIDIVEKCLSRYELEEVCVGFNGGKDCTALLHLVHAVLLKRRQAQKSVQNGHTHASKKNSASTQLTALYIRSGQPFPEVELFMKKCNDDYRLSVISVTGRIKDALFQLKRTHPQLKAVFMGTRRSDPHSAVLKDFSPTDEGWPEYIRVNPLLDWTYADLWSFIRRLSLPYCALYDRGYTSLGSMENTHPNPELRDVNERGIVNYRSAYLLTTSQNERAGRN